MYEHVNAYRQVHKVEEVGYYEKDVKLAVHAMAAMLFEKKILTDLKKPAGLSKMSQMRKAIADLGDTPHADVCPPLLEVAQTAIKKR